MPNALVASRFQSDSSGNVKSSAEVNAMCVHGESHEMASGRTPAASSSGLRSRSSSSSLVHVDDQSKR